MPRKRQQLTFALDGYDLRPRDKRTIYPPGNLRPVSDVVDPVLGGDEIHPCPPLAAPGTEWIVGGAREVWRMRDDMWIEDPEGKLWGAREASEEMQRRGARIVRAFLGWPSGTGEVRRMHPNAPLREWLCPEVPWAWRGRCQPVG